ncbi:MAG: PLP-dependent aminotransferase family protein [Bacteroidota bacterium]
MIPFPTLIKLDREAATPLYLQFCNAFIPCVLSGIIPRGHRLPGSRTMAELLTLSRKTVNMAYEELQAQGWVEIRPNLGCYVVNDLPIPQPSAPGPHPPKRENRQSHLEWPRSTFPELYISTDSPANLLKVDDGHPDVSISPLSALVRNLGFLIQTPSTAHLMNYHQAYFGDLSLRTELVKYLGESRGMELEVDNILLTRGSSMGFYLLFQTLLEPGDQVIVGDPGYNEGHQSILLSKGRLKRVPVDSSGIMVDEIESICKRERIKAIYLVPHHQYPTTVTLSAARRMKLLQLAEEHRFAIIEDDYDYDFHYSGHPILPMASYDHKGVVAYVGSFSKILAPNLRLGFIIATADLIQRLAGLSRYLDSHGNNAMERAVAMLFADGEIRRHLKKANRVYRTRRDQFCHNLQEAIGEHIDMKIPAGGLATWVQFRDHISFQKLQTQWQALGLSLPDSQLFCAPNQQMAATRMGFALMTEERAEKAIDLMHKGIQQVL